MEKYTTEINGTDIGIWVKIQQNYKGSNFKAIANLNFKWFEILGFRISYFDGKTKNDKVITPRRDDCLTVEEPKYSLRYLPAFRTTVAIRDKIQRSEVRKKYWYALEDAIIDAYYWQLDKETQETKLLNDKSNTDQNIEINLDDIPF